MLVEQESFDVLMSLPGSWLSQEYCESGWWRCVASGIRRDHFDRVFSQHTIFGDRAAGAKQDIFKDAVDVNIVTDVRLSVEIVGGLEPLN